MISLGRSGAGILSKMNDGRIPRRCQVILLDERRLDILVQVDRFYFGKMFFLSPQKSFIKESILPYNVCS